MISPARFALLHIRLSSHLYQPVYFSNFSATLGAGPDSCLSLVSHMLPLRCRKGAGEARTTHFVYSFQLTKHCTGTLPMGHIEMHRSWVHRGHWEREHISELSSRCSSSCQRKGRDLQGPKNHLVPLQLLCRVFCPCYAYATRTAGNRELPFPRNTDAPKPVMHKSRN